MRLMECLLICLALAGLACSNQKAAAEPARSTASVTAKSAKDLCASQCEQMRQSFKSGNAPQLGWFIDDCEKLCRGQLKARSQAEAEMIACWRGKPAAIDPLLECVPMGDAGEDEAPAAPVVLPKISWTKDAADCTGLCQRITSCRLGFGGQEDCEEACTSSEDDPITANAYACRYKARSCTAIAACDDQREAE